MDVRSERRVKSLGSGLSHSAVYLVHSSSVPSVMPARGGVVVVLLPALKAFCTFMEMYRLSSPPSPIKFFLRMLRTYSYQDQYVACAFDDPMFRVFWSVFTALARP